MLVNVESAASDMEFNPELMARVVVFIILFTLVSAFLAIELNIFLNANLIF